MSFYADHPRVMCQMFQPWICSRSATLSPENKPVCFENHWEYSSENTRFQIDRPK